MKNLDFKTRVFLNFLGANNLGTPNYQDSKITINKKSKDVYVFDSYEDYVNFFKKQLNMKDKVIIRFKGIIDCPILTTGKEGQIVALKGLIEYTIIQIKTMEYYTLFSQEKIDKIHANGKLTSSDKVSEAERLDTCIIVEPNGLKSNRCEFFSKCHDCLLEYYSAKEEYDKFPVQEGQEELIKRYSYLYENKELILALCIDYGIRTDYYKSELKRINNDLKQLKNVKANKDDKDLYSKTALSYKEKLKKELKEPKIYLYSNVSEDIINAYEEFLFTDESIENTKLYKHIEALKNNQLLLDLVQETIKQLEERREENRHLENIPTFTVWKILTYVKNKNKDNLAVLKALDKYYNLDRFIIANDNCSYGYYVPDGMENISDNYPSSTLFWNSNGTCVSYEYKGNEFEEEDKYFERDLYYKANNYKFNKNPKTNFMAVLVGMPMLPKSMKEEVYHKLKSSHKLN